MRRKLITDRIKVTTISSVNIERVTHPEDGIFPIIIQGKAIFNREKAYFSLIKGESGQWFLGSKTDWNRWPVDKIHAHDVIQACLKESSDLRKREIAREI